MRGEAVPTRDPQRSLVVLPILGASVAGIVPLAIPNPRLGLAVIGTVTCLFSVVVAAKRGGRYLVPSAVLFLSAGVFIGLAAVYLSIIGGETPPSVMRDVTVVAYITTLLTYVVTSALTRHWGVHWPTRRSEAAEAVARSERPPTRYALIAIALVVASQVGPLSDIGGPAFQAAGRGGVVMLTLLAAGRRVRPRTPGELFIAAGVVVVPLAWARVEFSGGGRLTLAGIGIAALVALNLTKPHAIHKVIVAVGLPVFLAFAGVNRIERRGAINEAPVIDVVSSGSGLASLYEPLDTFGRIIEHQSQGLSPPLGPRWGGTFFNTLILPVPRDLWATKPVGFGAELTPVLQPELAGKNHSMAALSHGEWFANFGWVGLLLMVVVLGWFLAVLDQRHARLAVEGLNSSGRWWSAAALLCLVSSLADLFWVGSFTFFARGGLAAIVVLLVGRLASGPVRMRAAPERAHRSRSRQAVGLRG